MYSENPTLPAGSAARGEPTSLFGLRRREGGTAIDVGGGVEVPELELDPQSLFGSAFQSARLVDNSNSAGAALERAYDERIDAVTKSGVPHSLVNPLRFGGVSPDASVGFMGQKDPYEEFDRHLHELARKHPDKAEVFKLDRSVREDAREKARTAEQRFEEVWGQLPNRFGAGYATRFAGGMAGQMYDPVNILALGAGPFGRVGVGAKELLWNAAKVGAVNAGAELTVEPFVQAWRKEAGLDYGLGHAALNIATAFGFGTAADLGIRGAYRGVRRSVGHEPILDAQGKVEGWQRPAQPLSADEALDAAAKGAAPSATVRKAAEGDVDALHRATKAVGASDDPAIKGARQAAEIEDSIAGKKPGMVDEGEALDKLAQAFRHATDEAEPPPSGVSPVVPQRGGYERIADGGPNPPAHFKLDGKPVAFREVPAQAVGFDAEKFQFKGGGNAQGVSERLLGVAQWDPIAAGRAIVYERADGSLVVADGHQRLALAKRLEAGGHEPIALPATVFREADGWTPADIRAIAARKNLQEGSGDVIDAARVIRERPDIIDSSVPLSAYAMRQARNLARLSDEAFGEVLAGRVAPNHAALVGDLVEAKAEHLGVIQALAEAEPNNEREARHIIADLLQGPRELVQEVLLGGHVRQALLAERAQVLDRALRLLKEDEKIFALLSKEAERISGAGNVLAVDANALRALRGDMVSALLETVASRPGPVRTWLDEAALAVANGRPVKAVAQEFADDVRGQIETHGLDGLKPEPPAPLRGRGIDDPAGAEAKAQIAELETALEQRLKTVALKVADANVDRWFDWQRLNKRTVPSLNPVVRAEVVKHVALGESVPDAIRLAREQVAASEAKRVIDLADAEAERMGALKPETSEDVEPLVSMWRYVDSARQLGKEKDVELAGMEAELRRYGVANAKSEAEVREILGDRAAKESEAKGKGEAEGPLKAVAGERDLVSSIDKAIADLKARPDLYPPEELTAKVAALEQAKAVLEAPEPPGQTGERGTLSLPGGKVRQAVAPSVPLIDVPGIKIAGPTIKSAAVRLPEGVFAPNAELAWTGLPAAEYRANLQHILEKRTGKDDPARHGDLSTREKVAAHIAHVLAAPTYAQFDGTTGVRLIRLGLESDGVVVIGLKDADRGRLKILTAFNQLRSDTLARLSATLHQQGLEALKWQKAPDGAGELLALVNQIPPRNRGPSWHSLRRQVIQSQEDAQPLKAVAGELDSPVLDFAPGEGERVAQYGPTRVRYSVEPDGGVYVEYLRTFPEARNLGAARAAMEQFLGSADQAGKAVSLIVEGAQGIDDARLGMFYASLGFREGKDGLWVREAFSAPMKAVWADTSPPFNRADYLDEGAYKKALNAQYFREGRKLGSSREMPVAMALPALGTWRISPIKGLYGHDIDHLVRVRISELDLPELEGGKLDPVKRGDDERYAQWLKEGKRPPPIEIVETEAGNLRVMDGHRRVLAAKLAGRDDVEAWVSRTVPAPHGNVDSNGKPILTGLTFEIAQGLRSDGAPLKAVAGEKHLTFGRELGTHADMRTSFPEADFWIVRKGSEDKVGSVTREFSPEHIGVLVRNHNILPDYLYYALMHVHQQGYFKERSHGTLRLKNIRLSDAKAVPVEGPMFPDIFPSKAVMGESDGALQRRAFDQLGFYSQALEAAKGLKQAKGTPEQMRSMLTKGTGVKEAELAATGFDKFLEGKTSVTRDEIVQHLEQNRVEVREKQYGSPFDNVEIRRFKGTQSDKWGIWDISSSGQQSGRLMGSDQGRWVAGPFDSEAEAHAAVPEVASESGVPSTAKWSQYSLDPSNPTYRESVLHLPELVDSFDEFRAASIANGIIDESVIASNYRNYNADAGRRAREDSRNFMQGHFAEPNVIAHARTSLQKDAQGRPVFLVDELQSDWGQKLRDGGARDEAKIGELTKAVETRRAHTREAEDEARALLKDYHKMPDWGEGLTTWGELERALRLEWSKADDGPAKDAMHSLANRLRVGAEGVRLHDAELQTATAATPGHPLVNTTDQWTSTAFRRLIRQAVEAGAESIAIIPGKVAADRFNLSRHVKGLMYLPADAASGRIEQLAFRHPSGHWQYEPVNADRNSGKTLEEFVGKELAQKLREAPKATDAEHAGLGWREIPDLGSVEIGGHGMRAAYDEIYPRMVGKLLKKMDPSIKQEATPLNSSMDGRVFTSDREKTTGWETAGDPGSVGPERKGTPPILFHTFPLTEKIKASVTEEGQPLFAAAQRTGRNLLPEGEEGTGAGTGGDWIDEQWDSLSRRATAGEVSHAYQRAGDVAQRVVQRIVPKSALEMEAGDLFKAARALEDQLRKADAGADEIATAVNERFGSNVTPEQVRSGKVWWREKELSAAEKGRSPRALLDTEQMAEFQKLWGNRELSVAQIAERMTETAEKPVSAMQLRKIASKDRERFPSRSDLSARPLLDAEELAELDRLWKTKLSVPEIAEQMRELFQRSDIGDESINYQASKDRERFPDRRALNPGRVQAGVPLFWTEPRLAELERVWHDPANVSWTATDLAGHMSEATGREVTPQAIYARVREDRERFPAREGARPWTEGERRLANMAHIPADPAVAAPLLSELFGRRISAKEIAEQRKVVPMERAAPAVSAAKGMVPDELISDSLAREAINSRVAAGAPIAVRAGIVDRTLAALAPHLDLVPEGFSVGTLARIEPTLAPAEARRVARDRGVGEVRVRAVIRYTDGSTREIDGPWKWFKGARALTFANPAAGLQEVIFFRAGLSGSFEHSLRGDLWHELVHVIFQSDAGPNRRLLDLLVDHAHKLRILDTPLSDYLEKVGRSDAVDTTGETLRQRYQREYAGMRSQPERLNQEAVAHLVELIYHRALPLEDIRPIAPLLKQLLDGRSGHASRLLDGLEAGEPLFAVIGRQARSADLMLLGAAQRMERAGRSEAEIFRLTNWYREGAGQWGSERSDIATELSPAAAGFAGARKGRTMTGPAEAFLKKAHQLEDYPELRGISVTLEKIDPRELPAGVADLEAGTIHIRAGTPREAAKKLVVELHRFIARHEGMAEGGTPASALEVVRRAAGDLDVEAANVLEQIAALPRLATAVRRAVGRNEAEQALRDDLAKLQAMRDELESLPMREAYRRLGGTVAGRNIERRFGWTQEMRAALSPTASEDTPRTAQLVARGPARQFAQDENEWQRELWDEMSRRSHLIQEAVARKEARPDFGGQSAHGKEAPHPLQKAVAEFERAQMAEGRTVEEVAAAIEARFGFPVDPVAIAKREVWWRIEEILEAETGGKGRGRTVRWRFEDDAELARLHAQGIKLDDMVEHMAKPEWLDRKVSRAAIETRLREKGLVSVARKGPLSEVWTEARNGLIERLHEDLVAKEIASAGRLDQRAPARIVTAVTERLQADIAEEAARTGRPVRRISERAVKDQMQRLRVAGLPDFWTTERDALLTRLWQETPIAKNGRAKAVAAKMSVESGRELTERAVYRRLLDIGVIDRSRGHWTPDMVAMLTSDEIARLTAADAAAVLSARFPGSHVSRQAIIGKRNRLGQDLDEQLRAAERFGVPVNKILEEDLGDPARALAEAEKAMAPILDAWRYVRWVKSQPVPERLGPFLVRLGGIKDEGGDLTVRGRGGKSRGAGQQLPGLLNKEGLSLDDATLRAWEAGYLTGTERPAINDLLEMLSTDLRGQPVVRELDKELWQHHLELPELENELARYGLQAARTEAEARQTLARRGTVETPSGAQTEGAGGAGDLAQPARGYGALGPDEEPPFFAVTSEDRAAQVDRIKRGLALVKEGTSFTNAGREVGLSVDTLRRWKKRVDAGEQVSIEAPTSQRLSPAEIGRIVQQRRDTIVTPTGYRREGRMPWDESYLVRSVDEEEPFKAVAGEPTLSAWRVGLLGNHGKPFGALRYIPLEGSGVRTGGTDLTTHVRGLLSYRSPHSKQPHWHPVSQFTPDELRAYLGPLADELLGQPLTSKHYPGGRGGAGSHIEAHELTGLKKAYLGEYWEANKQRMTEEAERHALQAQRDREWEGAAPARADVAAGEVKDAETASHLSELVKSCKA